jgi:photosynthetic reaction center cytochrome c subunit
MRRKQEAEIHMKATRTVSTVIAVSVVTLGLPTLTACHRTQAVQRGYRGQASVELFSEKTLAQEDEINKLVKPLRAAKTTGPKAADTYENVQVLGDLTQQQFVRTMLSIKAWVAPEAGCNYCHNAPDYASDTKYTKRVAREMLRMTRHINTDWTVHVAATGVTCYTCHRGQGVPAKTWYSAPDRQVDGDSVVRLPERLPTAAAANTALPIKALDDYLLHDDNVRVAGPTALQDGNRHSVSQARDTYGLMMVMSESLGVNCTFCHYTPAFYNWDTSTPQRAVAWYGIRMVRDLNNSVIVPLTGLLPPERLGPTGDAPKIYCATCHRGANKPLYGAPMIKDYPELVYPHAVTTSSGPAPASAPESAPATTAVSAPAAQPESGS